MLGAERTPKRVYQWSHAEEARAEHREEERKEVGVQNEHLGPALPTAFQRLPGVPLAEGTVFLLCLN